MTEQQMRAISIEELASSGKISRKTYNILVRAKMRSVFDLIRYKSGMARLFRAAAPCFREVNALIDEVEGKGRITQMSSLLFPPEPEWSGGEELLAGIDEEQMEYLEEVYKIEVEKLAAKRERAAERLAKVLAALSAKAFIRDFLMEDDERFIMLSDVKEASLPYLDSIKKVLNKQIEELGKSDMPINYKLLKLHAGGMLDNDSFAYDYFNQHGRLPILYLLQKNILFNKEKNNFRAFLQRYDIFGGKEKLDWTPIERSTFTITAYSNAIFDALFTPGESMAPLGEFMAQMLADTTNTSYLDKMMEGNFIGEDDPCLNAMIQEEQVTMQPKCIMAMMGKWMPQWLVCLGGYTRNLSSAMENRWKSTFLVRKELLDNVNMERELWMFKDNVVEQSKERHAMDLDEYVRERICHLKHNGDLEMANTVELPDWTPLFKRIVINELELEVDENGWVIIPQKRDKSLADRLYHILDTKKQAMTLDELTATINSDGGRRYVRASVSLALNRDDRFQGSGKKGWYALEVWKLPFFGSNADIVAQLLEESGRPMKGDEIVAILSKFEYNKQFSKGDLSSVFLNGKDRFVKLAPNFFGLVGKKYDEEAAKDEAKEEPHVEPEETLATNVPDELLGIFALEEASEEAKQEEGPAATVTEETPVATEPEEVLATDVPDELLGIFASEEVHEETKSEETPIATEPEEALATDVPDELLGIFALEEAPEEAKSEEIPIAAESEEALAADVPDELLGIFALEEAPEETNSEETPIAAEPEEALAEKESGEAPVTTEPEEALAADVPNELLGIFAMEETPIVSKPQEALSSEEEVSVATELQETLSSEAVEETIPEDEEMLQREEEWQWMCSNVMDFVRKNGREPLEMFTAEVELAAWLATQKEAMHQMKLNEDQCAKLLEIRDFLW